MTTMPYVTIHTDGAASPNPGPGGYGVVITGPCRDAEELSGGYRRTTNNRMEIMAVLVALEHLPEPSHVTMFSDSRYVVDAINKGWAKRWKRLGWMRNEHERALNADLWDRLLTVAAKHNLNLRWVRGHAGDVGNERADRLAVAASQGRDLPVDVGYDGNGR